MIHDKRFPNESEDYRTKRDELLRAEIELRRQVERLNAQRQELPLGGDVEDYRFERIGGDGSKETVRLSELFAPGQTTLLLYSYMYGPKMDAPCPMCTSFIDGLDVSYRQIRRRLSAAVVANSPIERVVEFTSKRNWNVPVLSCAGNSYARDYLAEDEEGNDWPMLNVFVKKDGGVRHFWGSELLVAGVEGQPRHVDTMWPLWAFLDVTPEGRGTDWYPEL